MSGFEVMGLLSAVISIIDASAKLYTAIKNDSALPEEFKDVTERMPLVKDTLLVIKKRLDKTELEDTTSTAIGVVITRCKGKAERLHDILAQVTAQPSDNFLKKFPIAARQIRKKSDVEALMKSLLEDVHLLAANDAVRAVGDDRINELLAAIEDLSQVPPSATDGPVITHEGVGDMMNNTGSGTQNVNKGTGHIHSAGTMYFGYPPN